MATNTCVKHQMPNGSIMNGPVHGPGQVCVEWDNTKKGGRTKPTPKNKNQGGMLVGPTHEQGGIPAIVGGNEMVELEGGEYIINAQTVNAVGQPFLDKLNSTQTEYHPGGFEQGQLPNPSNFDRGGGVKPRVMSAGGMNLNRRVLPINRKKMLEGGSTLPKSNKPMVSDGGKVNSKNVRKRNRNNKSMRTGGVSGRKTISYKGHFHGMNIDENGDGATTGGDHIHRIKKNIIEVTCPPNSTCHSH